MPKRKKGNHGGQKRGGQEPKPEKKRTHDDVVAAATAIPEQLKDEKRGEMTKRQKREEEDVKIADEEATKKGRERNSVPTPSAAVAPTTERNVFFTFGRNFSVKIPEGSFGGDLQNKIAGALGKNVVDIEIRLPKELMKYSTTPDATDTDTFMLDTMEKLDPEFFNTLDGLSKPDRALKVVPVAAAFAPPPQITALRAISFDPRDPVGSFRRAAEDREMSEKLGLKPKDQLTSVTGLDPVRAFSTFTGRERTIAEVLTFFQRKFNLDRRIKNKLDPTHAATYGAPGTGKSRLLDEVASLGQLSAEQLRSMSGGVPLSDDFLSTVVGWIPLCATYNGNTSYLAFENDHPMAFFAIRLLLSYLFKHADLNTPAVFSWMTDCKGFEQLTIDAVVRAVIEDFKRVTGRQKVGVFIGLDEFVLADGHSPSNHRNAELHIHQIGDICWSQDLDVYALTTTLDSVLIGNSTKKSGRPVWWISLGSPTVQVTQAMFPEGLKPVDRENERLVELVQTDAFKSMVADCGGHWRTIELLLRAAKEVATHEKPWTRQKLWEAMTNFICKTSETLQYSIPLLRAVLLGESVKLRDDVPGIPGKTFGYLIMEGTLCNSLSPEMANLDPDSALKPMVPPLRLRAWAIKHVGDSNRQLRALATVLLNMIDLEDDWSWEKMEWFHANWEAMVAILRPGETAELGDLYKGAMLSGTAVGRITVVLPDTFDVPQRAAAFPPPPPPPTEKLPHVIQIGGSNPGFDLFVVRWTSVRPRIAIVSFCEVKYSREGAKTHSVNQAEIDDKNKKLLAKLGERASQAWARDKTKLRSFLVFVACRKVTKKLSLPKDCIVISRDRLMALYGPNLSCFPQFLARKENKETNYQPEQDDED